MIEVRGLFLLDQFLEDANVVVSRNLDRELPLFVVSENKAVEQKSIRGTHHEGVLVR